MLRLLPPAGTTGPRASAFFALCLQGKSSRVFFYQKRLHVFSLIKYLPTDRCSNTIISPTSEGLQIHDNCGSLINSVNVDCHKREFVEAKCFSWSMPLLISNHKF